MSDVLVIDSSTNTISVAAGTSTLDSSSSSIDQASSHSENILNCVDDVLKERSSSINSVSAIGVGVGPGLFTGLRVGMSAAHAFAHALEVPLVYFSSLELSAKSSIDLELEACNEILIAKDARRHELYFAGYSFQRNPTSEVSVDDTTFASTMERVREEALISPKEFVKIVNSSENTAVVLDDEEKYEEFKFFDKSKAEKIIPARIDAKFGIDLVVDSVMLGVTTNVFSPKALYIRKSDAELSWGKQHD